jgi:hypothetical protein
VSTTFFILFSKNLRVSRALSQPCPTIIPHGIGGVKKNKTASLEHPAGAKTSTTLPQFYLPIIPHQRAGVKQNKTASIE